MKYRPPVSLIFFLQMLCFNATFAQRFVENYWHYGTVFLEEGDTLTGNLKFSLQDELIQIDAPTGLQTLTARNVLAFRFFDRMEQRDRYYYALPYPKVANYPTPTYFELLMQGEPITLLSRESLTVETMVNNNPYAINPGVPITRTVLKTDFFFLYKSGKITPFNGTKKGILYLLREREQDIKKYLKENRVNFENKSDMLRLIEYYNSKIK